MTKEQIEKLGITYVEGMTDEDVIAKINENKTALETKANDFESKVKSYKSTIDKYSSEIAEYKKKEAEKLTDEEKRDAHLAELEADLAKAKRTIAETEKVNTYVSIGYSKELAQKVAVAELEGKDASKYHQEFMKAREEAIKAELMKKNPNLDGGGGGGDDKFTKENFKAGKISMEEMNELKVTDPAKYDSIIKG